MLTHSVASPLVSFQSGTQAPDGSTLPPAGGDGKAHSEGAFMLHLHKP